MKLQNSCKTTFPLITLLFHNEVNEKITIMSSILKTFAGNSVVMDEILEQIFFKYRIVSTRFIIFVLRGNVGGNCLLFISGSKAGSHA